MKLFFVTLYLFSVGCFARAQGHVLVPFNLDRQAYITPAVIAISVAGEQIVYKNEQAPAVKSVTTIFLRAIMGWPIIVISCFIAVVGIYFKKAFMLIIAAILSAPFSYYLWMASNQLPSSMSFLIPLGLVVAWYVTKKEYFAFAWLSLTPIVLIIFPLAFAVLSQPFP